MRSLADDDEDYENCFNILNEISPDIADAVSITPMDGYGVL